MATAALSCSGRGHAVVALWLILLLVGPAKAATVAVSTQRLQFGVAGDTPTLIATGKHQQRSVNTTAATPATTPNPIPTTTATTKTTIETAAATATRTTDAAKASHSSSTAATTVAVSSSRASTTTAAPTTTVPSNILSAHHAVDSVVQLLDLEITAAPPMVNGHDGRKLTKKKQLQQQHFVLVESTTRQTDVEKDRTTSITSTTSTTLDNSTPPELMPVPNGYLGPIFMGEKTFSVVHPLKKPTPTDHVAQVQQPPHGDTIEQQLRQGRIVEILAPTALLESNVESSSLRPATTTTTVPAAPPQSVLSMTVFQVPELQSSTTRLPMAAAEISVAGSAVLAAPPRTESKISDIQIEVYDSTVDSIVASTNFRDTQGAYPLPLEPTLGTTKPPSSPMTQERFTQYVIDRADVSTQPAAGMSVPAGGVGKPEPAAIEIHINVSEAFGNESEDLEFSYRQPSVSEAKGNNNNKPNDEILVVEIIDNGNGDNSTENSSSASGEHLNLNPLFNYPYHSDAPPPAVRPPQEAADELFMAETKSGDRGLPRPPPPPPPPPMPRKPNIDRDSDTIFYISNTEVKVGESLPTASSNNDQQQRKLQFENQFFPAGFRQESSQQRNSVATPRYEEDILLSPQHHTADALKILRSPSLSLGSDGAPPLDVTYVGESVIEVEQQSLPPQTLASSQQPDIIIQPAVLPDLAIGVPVIGELPPQIELKEIDYMPGELIGQGRSIYENDIENNGLGLSNDPDVIESSIQYGGDLIDDGAGGGFDGVEGSYPFDSPAHRQQQQQDIKPPPHSTSHQTINHRYSHLHREEMSVAEILNATLQRHNESLKNRNGASAMAPLLHGERMGNATALSDDPMANYDGFLNLFAVSMGLIIVVLPAGLLTSMYCAVRYLLNKNAIVNAAGDDSEQGQGPDYKNESSSCSVASFSSPTSQLSNPQTVNSMPIRISNPELNLNPNPNASLIRSMSLALASGVQHIEFQFETGPEILTPPSASAATPTISNTAFAFSGSVTKMTLKDNHLIVVTEERHDISRNARETKMHTDKDGVFVVEVARGIDSKQPPDSPGAGADITELPFDTNNKQPIPDERSLPPSHEQVQIHAPPSDFANLPVAGATVVVGAAAGLQQIDEEEHVQPEEEHEFGIEQNIQSQTGLSQSDLSSTSSSDSNKRYSYGNQELYVIEQPGYVNDLPLALTAQLPATETDNEPQRMMEQQQQPEQAKQALEPQPPAQPEHEPEPEPEPQPPAQTEPQEQPKPQQQQQQQPEPQEMPLAAPVAFGNGNASEAEKAAVEVSVTEQPLKEEPENSYDSLLSLPAPPSTEEIKELNDFTLIESNQLDSLPPPPPPLSDAANGAANHNQPEEQKEEKMQVNNEKEGNAFDEPQPEVEQQQQQQPKPIDLVNGKICAPPTTATPPQAAAAANGEKEPEGPATLTPPASPPASPSATPSGSTMCAGGLSNGIHAVPQPMAVDVNGS